MRRFTVHRKVSGFWYVYDNSERRELDEYDTRKAARDVSRWENSQVTARRSGRPKKGNSTMVNTETTGTAYQRLLHCQTELNSWGRPLGDLDMLRNMVAELIDINLQAMHERDEWRGPKPPSAGAVTEYWDRYEKQIIGAMKNTIDDHGPITKDLISSVMKRFRGSINQQKNSND